MVVWVMAVAVVAGIVGKIIGWFVALLFWIGFLWIEKPPRMGVLLFAVLFGVFAFYGYRSKQRLIAHGRHVRAVERAEPLSVRGWVSSFPIRGRGYIGFDFRTTIDGVSLTTRVWAREYAIAYGDCLSVEGVLSAPEDAAEQFMQWGRGTTGTLRVKPGKVVRLRTRYGDAITRHVFSPLHRHIRDVITRHMGHDAGLPIALLLGERALLDRGLRDVFTSLGLAHFLALSGFHLGFLVAFVLATMSALHLRSRWPLLFVLALYVGCVGQLVSLHRAFWMAVTLVGATIIHRPLRPLDSLANALLIVLLLAPHAIFSVAFQLSFLATFAVLLVVSRMAKPTTQSLLGRLLYGVVSTIRISTGVQIALLPVLLTYFGRVSVVGPLVTPLFVLPIGALLLLTLLAVSTIQIAPVSRFCFFVVEHLSSGVAMLAQSLQIILPQPIALSAPSLLLYYGGLCGFWFGRKRWVRVVAVVVMLLSFVVV